VHKMCKNYVSGKQKWRRYSTFFRVLHMMKASAVDSRTGLKYYNKYDVKNLINYPDSTKY